jgi:hypothetical protein
MQMASTQSIRSESVLRSLRRAASQFAVTMMEPSSLHFIELSRMRSPFSDAQVYDTYS